jgi:hypothetical protein
MRMNPTLVELFGMFSPMPFILYPFGIPHSQEPTGRIGLILNGTRRFPA